MAELLYQEFPIEMIPAKQAEGWELAGPCRPYALSGYSVWMKRAAHCGDGDTAQPKGKERCP